MRILKYMPTDTSLAWNMILINLLVCFFRDRVSLCSPGCPGAYFVDQTGHELTEIRLGLLKTAEIKGMCHHWADSIKFF